jgi:uncharacterized protein with HEPN domain
MDMLEAIERVERYAERGEEAFRSDELIQVYILHHLQILGEAAYKLPSEFRSEHSQIPWPSIIGMRHVLVHDYFEVDLDLVWAVVEKELQSLKLQLQQL